MQPTLPPPTSLRRLPCGCQREALHRWTPMGWQCCRCKNVKVDCLTGFGSYASPLVNAIEAVGKVGIPMRQHREVKGRQA